MKWQDAAGGGVKHGGVVMLVTLSKGHGVLDSYNRCCDRPKTGQLEREPLPTQELVAQVQLH